jgi:hypothetical protein
LASRTPKPSPDAKAAYERQKAASATWNKRQSAAGRDIGPIPPPANQRRRKACESSFRLFCETYGAESFPLAWSPDHLTAIAKIESAVLRGELFAFAMPRGSGKTTLAIWACLWAMLYGHKDFVMLIGADQAIASAMLDSVKSHLEMNPLLLEDFPAACLPIKALDGIPARANGQTCEGVATELEWKVDRLTLPWIQGQPSAGVAIRVAGITGRIRGVMHTRPDGKTVRPTLVLVDDPQTDESANSPSQCSTRERTLAGAILGLAGPGKKIAGLATITVIRPDDLADRLLDRNRHPAWQGERTKLVYDWPTRDELWSQYAESRRQGQRDGSGTAAADAFYRDNQADMDAGSRVAWPERRNEDELTALQHAWNLRIDRGEAAFMAEYQNQPMADDIASDKLDKRALASRTIPVPRGTVPAGHSTLTAFVDVQDKLLFWLVASWSESFGGHVVAYGCYPDQAVSFFEARHAKRTLSLATKGASIEGAWHAGLEQVAKIVLGTEWQREDGMGLRVGQMLIDANYGQSTQVVRNFCKRSAFAAQLLPSHGKGIGASKVPLSDAGAKGDKVGLQWRVGRIGTAKDQRSAIYDTNFWKSFVAARLRMQLGDPEALTLHKGDHELLLEHLTAEFPVRTEARGRVVDEWQMQPGRDNHWFDCLVGSAVAASIAGVQPTASEAGGRRRRKVEIPTGHGGQKRITVRRLGA